jgi:hypothetical protein
MRFGMIFGATFSVSFKKPFRFANMVGKLFAGFASGDFSAAHGQRKPFTTSGAFAASSRRKAGICSSGG